MTPDCSNKKNLPGAGERVIQMNTPRDTTREQDELFADWSEDRQSATPQSLQNWVRRHPDYAAQLMQWAVDAPLLECAMQQPADPIGEARTAAIGRQVLAEMRARYLTDTATEPETALTSLYAAAQKRGMSVKALAAQIGVGVPLVAKLQQRLVRATTLPEELVSRLSEALQVSGAQIRAYLNQPSGLATGASYKSDDVPQAGEPEDFATAVRACADMSASQKQFWLSQIATE